MSWVTLANKVTHILNWLSLMDYNNAKEEAAMNIISRYGRGNMSFQNGNIVDRKGLEALSKQGDKALERLKKLSANA